jgi:hypothetical protein
MNTDLIFILIHSLKYEADPTQCQVIERSQFFRMKEAEKRNKYRDSFIERVSPSKFSRESRTVEREESRKQYDQAIMKKYNVGSDYKQNRWFIEQLRPTV